MVNPTNSSERAYRRFLIGLCCVYTLLLIYGTLYPFNWQWHATLTLEPFLHWPKRLAKSDFITNLLVYIPLGLLLGQLLKKRFGVWATVLIATTCGTLLSFSLEYLQLMLPNRVSSLADVALNSTGSFLGAGLSSIFSGTSVFYRSLAHFRKQWFLPGAVTNVGLIVIGLWALSQLMPLVPSLDMATMRHGLKPIWHTLNNLATFDFWQASTYTLNIFALCALSSLIIKPERPHLRLLVGFVVAVLLFKVPVIGRQLSLEAISGAVSGMVVYAIMRPKTHTTVLAACALIAALVVDTVHASNPYNILLRDINWIPFRGQMRTVMGLADLSASLWPFAALAFLVIHRKPRRLKTVVVTGGILVFCFAFSLELVQQYIPGRYPDITDVLLATAGWGLAWWYYCSHDEGEATS